MRHNPHLYEINTRVFLRRLSLKYGQRLTLATVPEIEWRQLAQQGFDIIWLMGAWQRSPAARRPALELPALRRLYSEILPGWTDKDIDSSPYAIYSYTVDKELGKEEELIEVKERLNHLGLKLMVDFVSNHLALDHPWTKACPDCFVCGGEKDIEDHPEWFFTADKKRYLAHGRDPYFPPWTDTVQVNFYSEELRRRLTGELLRIARMSDGVRCDVAMLALSEVFTGVWGKVVTGFPPPETEFWVEAISHIKKEQPEYIFLAEVYWGLGRKLQQLGFDYTYDKVLYDKLRFSEAIEIRHYLETENDDPQHLARFIENHDEPRAMAALGRERSLAAAAAIATLPGMRFFHDGQFEGRKIRLPVQMVREPEETAHPKVKEFYQRLLAVCHAPVFHYGQWHYLTGLPAWEGNGSNRNLLTWAWQQGKKLKVTVVNYSPERSQCRIKLPIESPGNSTVWYQDELTGAAYSMPGNEINNQGLYVDLQPWQCHILSFG